MSARGRQRLSPFVEPTAPAASGFAAEIGSAPTAPWWREDLSESAFDRRTVLAVAVLGSAPLGLGGCATFGGGFDPVEQAEERIEPALDVQRREGWNTGAENLGVALPASRATDVDESERWRLALQDLAWWLAPTQPALVPWYVPTLFQSVGDPGSHELREAMRPELTDDMRAGFDVGRALLAVLRLAGSGGAVPLDTLLVVDVPGAQSVAVAAALAERYEPVFQFDNWPHPKGVVRSEEVLGAALYYAPLFERARGARPAPAPPAIILDADRLAPYHDEPDRFDNRYQARLPSGSAMAALGIRHVLYVVPRAGNESDDLNADFVDLSAAGIDVRQVALSDFQPADPFDDEDSRFAAGLSPGLGDPPVDDEWYWSVDLPVYWGGSRRLHATFWDHYGWHRGRLGLHPLPMARALPPPRVLLSVGYRPQLRLTLFSETRPLGRARSSGAPPRPLGFGFVHHFGYGGFGRAGWGGFGRSGSLGRGGFGFGG